MNINIFTSFLKHFRTLENDSKSLTNQNRYKEILIHISDGLHNYQEGAYFKENDTESAHYEKNIRDFFSYIRWVQLDHDICSEDKYQRILNFIKNDFYNYFNAKSNSLDFAQFKLICEGK